MKTKRLELTSASIERRILLTRGLKVMLDSDLASLYEVSTKRLNEQVQRNLKRFPADFMIQLSPNEYASLRSQNATLKPGRGRHRKYRRNDVIRIFGAGYWRKGRRIYE